MHGLGGIRAFDACWVPHNAPDRMLLPSIYGFGLYMPNIRGKGRYDLRYMVIADGFPVARCVATLELDGATLPTTLSAM